MLHLRQLVLSLGCCFSRSRGHGLLICAASLAHAQYKAQSFHRLAVLCPPMRSSQVASPHSLRMTTTRPESARSAIYAPNFDRKITDFVIYDLHTLESRRVVELGRPHTRCARRPQAGRYYPRGQNFSLSIEAQASRDGNRGTVRHAAAWRTAAQHFICLHAIMLTCNT